MRSRRRRRGRRTGRRHRARRRAERRCCAHSYTCRYLRTKRIATMFMTQRDDEEQQADGEDRLVARSMPVGLSPLPVAAMKVVIVCIGLERVEVSVGDLAGRDEHDHRLADRARERRARRRRRCRRAPPGRRRAVATGAGRAEPVRALAQRRCGTADIASSEIDAIVGTIMMPMTSPADSALKTLTSMSSRSWRSRRDEGEREVAEDDRRHAASTSRIGLTILRTRGRRVLGEVDRRAEPERDRDDDARSPVISSVPLTSGSTPNSAA